MSDSDRFYSITGGPGSGKSTLIAALSAAGFQTMPEAGRAIIRDQVTIGGNALPSGDRSAFAELMLSWEMRSWREAQMLSGPVIFDRGIPDTTGYLSLCGMPVPRHFLKAAQDFRYNRRAFTAPPWAEIFIRDAERKQTFAEAEATYRAVVETYVGLGYELIELPLASIAERVHFMRSIVG